MRLSASQTEIEVGAELGVHSYVGPQIERLEQDLREMKDANKILKIAAIFSGQSSTAKTEFSRSSNANKDALL